MVTISQARRADGRRLSRPGLRLRTAQVDSRDIGSEWGMAVLSPARTALDVARLHGFEAGLVLADSALARGLATAADLDRIATAMVGWNSTRARLVADHASGRRESPAESWSFAVFALRGLPLPECNEWVVGRGRGGIRPDFFWRRHRLAGEADGQVKYTNPYGPPERALVEEKARQLRCGDWLALPLLGRPVRHGLWSGEACQSSRGGERIPRRACRCDSGVVDECRV
jgi:hypothetical protein